MLCIPSSSVEFIRCPVTGEYTISTQVDMAVIPYGAEPASADWKSGEWDDGYAKVKIGAGSDVGELDEGTYGVWVRATTSDEAPVLYSGMIRIT